MADVTFEEVQRQIEKLRREVEKPPESIPPEQPADYPENFSQNDEAPDYENVLREENKKLASFLDEATKLKYEFQNWYKEQHQKQLEEYRPALQNELQEGAELEVEISEGTGKNGIVKKNDYLLFVEGAKKGMKVIAKVIWLNHESKTGWLRPVDKIVFKD